METYYKILIVLVLLLLVWGVNAMILKQSITIYINQDTIIKFGEKLHKDILDSHSVSSAFTDETKDDDLLLYPQDTTHYKFMRVLTINDKVESLHVYFDTAGFRDIQLLIEGFWETE